MNVPVFFLQVPCDVLFSVKAHVTKATSKFNDVFEVDPPRAQIAPHSHTYAVLTFSPPSMQVSGAHTLSAPFPSTYMCDELSCFTFMLMLCLL